MKKTDRPKSGVLIERPRRDERSLAAAKKAHDEVMAILEQQPPEETLEEVMSELRGRPWSS